jgi:hypothetical protein
MRGKERKGRVPPPLPSLLSSSLFCLFPLPSSLSSLFPLPSSVSPSSLFRLFPSSSPPFPSLPFPLYLSLSPFPSPFPSLPFLSSFPLFLGGIGKRDATSKEGRRSIVLGVEQMSRRMWLLGCLEDLLFIFVSICICHVLCCVLCCVLCVVFAHHCQEISWVNTYHPC